MSTTVDIDQLPADTRCFRLRRYYLVVGIVSAVFWAAVGIAFRVAALWNIDGSFDRPKRDALILGIIWSGFMLLGVWMIAAYFRNRLFFGKTAIVQRGIFRSRILEVGEVLQIKWRTRPVGGSVVIRTHSQRATIELGHFTRDEREELIRFVRESFAVEIQENWSRFQDVVGRSSPRGKRASRGGIIAIAALLMCFAGVFVYCWLLYPLLCGSVVFDPARLAEQYRARIQRYFASHPAVEKAWVRQLQELRRSKSGRCMDLRFPSWGQFVRHLEETFAEELTWQE